MKDQIIIAVTITLISLIAGWIFKVVSERNERRFEQIEKKQDHQEIIIAKLMEELAINTAVDKERKEWTTRLEAQLNKIETKIDHIKK